MKLIDADQLINAIKEEAIVIDFDKEINRVVVRDVEYVPVIRCKDCKFSVKDEYNIFHGSEISNKCIAMGAVVSPDDYCSWAERKEE